MNFYNLIYNGATKTYLYTVFNTIKSGKNHRGRSFPPVYLHKTFEENKDKKRWSVHSLPGVMNIAGMKQVYVALLRCITYISGKKTWRYPNNQNYILDSRLMNDGGQMSEFISIKLITRKLKIEIFSRVFGVQVTFSRRIQVVSIVQDRGKMMYRLTDMEV